MSITSSGWLKLHRNMLSWQWFSDAITLQLFIYMLIRASFENTAWQGITINRGELITSYAKMSLDTTISVQQIRTILAKLKHSGEIELKSTSKYTKITICKYDYYQNDDKKFLPLPTNQQQTNNKPTTTYKNIKKEKNEKNKDLTHSDAEILEFKDFEKWIISNTPSLRNMQESLTISQYTELTKTLQKKDLKRLMLAMHNKGAGKNTSTYLTILTYAEHDKILNKTKKKSSKLYTYDEVCNLVHTEGCVIEKNFKLVKKEGKTLWHRV